MLNKKCRIGAFCGIDKRYVDETHIKEVADAGIDFVFVESGFSREQIQFIGECCDKYNIDFLITDDKLYGPMGKYSESKEITSHYNGFKGFMGNFINDEPNAEQYDYLSKAIDAYKKSMPDKMAVINLLPMYGPEGCLKADSYEDYVNQYVEKINTPFIAVDVYPCGWLGPKKVTYEKYCRNLDIVATAARKSDREFWGFLQATSWLPGVRIPDETDLRWQAYAHLAFGASTIMYFTYICPAPNETETFKHGFIDVYGNKTSTYYYGKAVNREVRKVMKVIESYQYDGSFNLNYSDKVPYLQFDNCCEKPAFVKEIQSNEPVLAGVFSKESSNALIIVNMSELEDEKNAEISLSLEKDSLVKTYGANTEHSFKVKAGEELKLTLDCGCGILITAE